jgi:DNA polymerase III alpha subunit
MDMDEKKKQFIADVNLGGMVDSTFIVSARQVKKKKNGEEYCSVTFQDKSGMIEAVMWTEVFNACRDFAEGDLVEVKGILKEYRGSKQLIVNDLNKIQRDGDIGGFNIIMENTSYENDWSDYVRNFERPVYVRQLELAEESDSRSSNTENREREISKDKGQAPEDTDQEGLF